MSDKLYTAVSNLIHNGYGLNRTTVQEMAKKMVSSHIDGFLENHVLNSYWFKSLVERKLEQAIKGKLAETRIEGWFLARGPS